MGNLEINLEKISKGCRTQDFATTLAYLKASQSIFWSWGVSEYVKSDELRWLRLTINGRHHKGYVYIFLNGSDLFDVHYTSKEGVIALDDDKDLYFDQLVEAIDNKVEYINSYSR